LLLRPLLLLLLGPTPNAQAATAASTPILNNHQDVLRAYLAVETADMMAVYAANAAKRSGRTLAREGGSDESAFNDKLSVQLMGAGRYGDA
jgi:hypothetical protein